MKRRPFSVSVLGVSLLAAAGASLCCIAPLLALLGGAAGLASRFSWLAPARPYLIALALLALGFAWFVKLRSLKHGQADCACDHSGRPEAKTSGRPFWSGIPFLSVVTGLSILLMGFPFLENRLSGRLLSRAASADVHAVRLVSFNVTGMDCEACARGTETVLGRLPGIRASSVQYDKGLAHVTVRYDADRMSPRKLDSVIAELGYRIAPAAQTKTP